MANICILTDNLVQYPIIRFKGQNRIRKVSYHLSLNGEEISDIHSINKSDLPPSADDNFNPHLLSPTISELWDTLSLLTSNYDEVIGIFSSAAISPMYNIAQKAAAKLEANARIHIIDSRTSSVGLSILVMQAAIQAEKGESSKTIIQNLYTKIPQIFTLFNIPSLSYLYYNNLIDRSQAFVGEKLELLPYFVIEEDDFITTDKMRNDRHITDYFLEFLNEFENVEFVSFLHSTVLNSQASKLIRELVKHKFPDAEFFEHKIPITLAILFGPKCQGMIVVDNEVL